MNDPLVCEHARRQLPSSNEIEDSAACFGYAPLGFFGRRGMHGLYLRPDNREMIPHNDDDAGLIPVGLKAIGNGVKVWPRSGVGHAAPPDDPRSGILD